MTKEQIVDLLMSDSYAPAFMLLSPATTGDKASMSDWANGIVDDAQPDQPKDYDLAIVKNFIAVKSVTAIINWLS